MTLAVILKHGGHSETQQFLRLCDFCAVCISSKCQGGGDGLVVKVRGCFKNLINRGSPSKLIKNLLDSDTCSLDGRFSKEHVWVRCDPFSILRHSLLLFQYAYIPISSAFTKIFLAFRTTATSIIFPSKVTAPS